jgi:hypothetical protein
MRKHRRAWRFPALSVLFTSAVLALGLTSATGEAAQAASTGVAPNSAGEMDCNGLSPVQHPVKIRTTRRATRSATRMEAPRRLTW